VQLDLKNGPQNHWEKGTATGGINKELTGKEGFAEISNEQHRRIEDRLRIN